MGRWNVVVAFVDGGEYVAIAGDFLLGTIVWRGFSCNQCVESLVAGRDTFNTIGCVGALNACNRDECVQQISLIAACTLWRPLASWMADSSVVVRGVSSPLAAVM